MFSLMIRSHRLTTILSDGVKVFRTDYTPASLKTALTGQDAVISVLGGGSLGDPQFALIDAAVAAGVKRFVPSEYGSDTTDEKVVAFVPFFKGKQAVTAHLRKKESEGLQWTGVITGPFFDWVCLNSPQAIYT